MYKKNQTCSGNQTSSGRHSLNSTAKNVDTLSEQHPHSAVVLERARLDLSLSAASDVRQLQRTIGNQAVISLLAQKQQNQQNGLRQEERKTIEKPKVQRVIQAYVDGTNSPATVMIVSGKFHSAVNVGFDMGDTVGTLRGVVQARMGADAVTITDTEGTILADYVALARILSIIAGVSRRAEQREASARQFGRQARVCSRG